MKCMKVDYNSKLAWLQFGAAENNPETYREGHLVDAILAESPDQVHGEEWEPAAYETADDDPQRLCGLGLHAETSDLTLDVALPERPRRGRTSGGLVASRTSRQMSRLMVQQECSLTSS